MTRLRTVIRVAPSAWAPALINSDASGLDMEEIVLLERWLAKEGLPGSACVGCVPAGFRWHYDASAQMGGAKCELYHFLIRA